MLDKLQADLKELQTRFANAVRYGTIKQVNALKVVVDLGNDLESPELPYYAPSTGSATLYLQPKVGDQVLVLAPNGAIEQACVFPSIYKQGEVGTNDEWSLVFEKGSIAYNDGKLTIKADTKVILDSEEVELAGSDGGGVVCKNSICAFTGAMHPDASNKVKAGL